MTLAQFFQKAGYNPVHFIGGRAGGHLQLFGEPARDFLLPVHEAMLPAPEQAARPGTAAKQGNPLSYSDLPRESNAVNSSVKGI